MNITKSNILHYFYNFVIFFYFRYTGKTRSKPMILSTQNFYKTYLLQSFTKLQKSYNSIWTKNEIQRIIPKTHFLDHNSIVKHQLRRIDTSENRMKKIDSVRQNIYTSPLSKLDREKYLKEISDETGQIFELNAESQLSITIVSSFSYVRLSEIILILSKQYEDRVAIHLKPHWNYIEPIGVLEEFIEEFGYKIQSVDFGLYCIIDSFVEKIIYHCPNLQDLRIHSTNLKGEGLKNICDLKNLLTLNLHCINLETLPDSINIPNLVNLNIEQCYKLTKISNLDHLKNLKKLNFYNCSNLVELPSLECLTTLEELDLSLCYKIEKFPDISRLINLKVLELGSLKKLIRLPNLKTLTNLETLDISYCENLVELDLIGLESFNKLNFNCQGLDHSQILKILPTLLDLNFKDALETLEQHEIKNLELFKELILTKIKNQKTLFPIFFIALDSSINEVRDLLASNDLPTHSFLHTFSLLGQIYIDDFSLFYETIYSFCKAHSWSFPGELLEIIIKKEPQAERAMLLHIMRFLGSCCLSKVTSEEFKLIIDSGFIKAALNYADPEIRKQFVKPMIAYSKNERVKEWISDHLQSNTAPHTKIPLLLLSQLYNEGITRKTCDTQLKTVSHKKFREGKNLRLYVSVLHSILVEERMKIEDKEYILAQLDFSDYENLQTLKTIKDIDKLSELNNEQLQKISIQDFLYKIINKIIPIGGIENFNDFYMKHFSKTRIPNFILPYAASLKKQEYTLKPLIAYMKGVFTGNYPLMRYDMTKSKHLELIFSKRPQLLAEWTQGEEIPLDHLISTKKSYEGYTITDTDNYVDVFLSGTEAGGTCQSIYNNIMSHCLMAYVLDGKNRLLAIKDKSGKIIVRRIFRILWDGKEPVLFIEQTYPANVTPILDQALKTFALQRAKALRLPLLAKMSSEPEYPYEIHSIGTLNTLQFEYCDANKRQTNGTFSLRDVNRLDKNESNRE